jgi:hypothetical protein
MANETITMEWIATATKMNQVIDRLNSKFDKQEKALQKLANASKKAAADSATGFNKLEKEFKQNVAALKKLEMGTKEYAAQKRKVDSMRLAYKKTKDEINGVNQGTKVAAVSTGTMATSMKAAGASGLALFMALTKVVAVQREIVSGGADVAVNIDTMARRMQVQAGLTDPERQERTRRVIDIASREDIGATAATALGATTQLASSGFKGDPTKTGTLSTVLGAMQATNFQGSSEEFVKGFAQALSASGLDKTNDNLEKLALQTQGLFKTTDFQIAELGDFSKQASVFEGANLSTQQSLAGFTALREILPAAESARGLKNFVAKLQQGDATKASAKKLAGLGVKSEDVDFVGENLIDVIKTIKASTDKLPEEKRNQALIQMFGLENIASSKVLLNSVERINELETLQGNVGQFRQDQLANAGGMQAGRNRIDNQRLLDVMPNAAALNELENNYRRRENKNKAIIEQAGIKFGALGSGAATTGTFLSDVGQDIGSSINQIDPESEFGLHMIPGGLLIKMLIDETKANRPLKPQPMRPKQAALPAAAAP